MVSIHDYFSHSRSSLANEDYRAGTNNYQSMVIDQLNIVFGLYSLYDQYGYNDDAM